MLYVLVEEKTRMLPSFDFSTKNNNVHRRRYKKKLWIAAMVLFSDPKSV
jgi:hypothetical protein